ncbi:NAD-dependent epimerase/dehydratase family protein [Marinomonas ostreistagni]|uniref:NAD-dependent epimerase/dehydratase family protein n=1 Tax=Marinomonas ostreistagni TaxID=359209 RepID=UPI001950D9EA|nr:NAD-dependent epimerase/dehydratase family protein [Marinomonas ostreistagni]MBM6550586.1 NAD-dependent epimerase/dehydratase family protein [Marinomonas ostreistagni]
MTKVLVAGCGDLGRGIAEYFVAQGAEVTGMRYQGTEFPVGVLGLTGDLRQLESQAWPEVDLVYLIMTPNSRTGDAYKAAYVEAAEALVNAYQGRPQPAVVFVSSTSVYGQNNGAWISDDTLAVPASDTAVQLLAAEECLKQGFARSISVRCSGIYGPGRYRLLEGVREGQAWGANQWTNRIHRDDVVSALCLVGEQALAQQPLPEHIIATDTQPTSMWEVKLWLAARLNVLPPLDDSIAFSDYFPAKGKRIVSQALRDLGWQPQYPSYVLGYESLLSSYQRWRQQQA